MERLPLFVFGTLRQGQWNHHYLAGRFTRMIPARLPGYARVQTLMIAPQKGSEVQGELCFLRDDVYEEAMADCDGLEGIPPGTDHGTHYARVQVSVITAEGEHTAWAYVRPSSPQATADPE